MSGHERFLDVDLVRVGLSLLGRWRLIRCKVIAVVGDDVVPEFACREALLTDELIFLRRGRGAGWSLLPLFELSWSARWFRPIGFLFR